MIRSLLASAALLLAGCEPPSAPLSRPTHVTVLPFVGPPGGAASGGFVVAYDPWSGSVKGVTVKNGPPSQLVTDAAVRCTNMPCRYDRESRYVALEAESVPSGTQHIEIVIEKEGYETLQVSIPLTTKDRHPTVLVVLTPKTPPTAEAKP